MRDRALWASLGGGIAFLAASIFSAARGSHNWPYYLGGACICLLLVLAFSVGRRGGSS